MRDVLEGLDPELARRVKVVLMNLTMLSEGNASSPHSLAPPAPRERHECPRCNGKGCPRCKNRGTLTAEARHRSVQAHHESSIPAGVNIDRKSTEAPSKDDSLYDHYFWMFGRALKLKDQRQLWELLVDAEQDWAVAIGRPEEAPREKLAAQRRYLLETTGEEPTEEELMEAVVALHEGRDKHMAARIEGCSVGFIEKSRRRHNRNLIDGRTRPAYKEMSEAERADLIADLRGRDMSREEVAEYLDVSKGSLRRFWPKDDKTRGESYSDEECVLALRSAREMLGRAPKYREYEDLAKREPSYPSARAIERRFGSWGGALRQAA